LDVLRQLTPAVVVAQGDRDRPLGLRLTNDVAVELLDDLGRGQAGRALHEFCCHPSLPPTVNTVAVPLVYTSISAATAQARRPLASASRAGLRSSASAAAWA